MHNQEEEHREWTQASWGEWFFYFLVFILFCSRGNHRYRSVKLDNIEAWTPRITWTGRVHVIRVVYTSMYFCQGTRVLSITVWFQKWDTYEKIAFYMLCGAGAAVIFCMFWSCAMGCADASPPAESVPIAIAALLGGAVNAAAVGVYAGQVTRWVLPKPSSLQPRQPAVSGNLEWSTLAV